MSELEEIKQRAAERRRPREFHAETMEAEVHRADVMEKLWGQAEADLDRAIEIAKGFKDAGVIARSVTKFANDQCDQARADVLKLREELQWWVDNHDCCPIMEVGGRNILTDTERYETFR